MSDAGFFEIHRKLAGGRSSLPAAAAPAEPLTPSGLNRLVEQALKTTLPPVVIVRGEVSNFNRNRASGHLYFTLKDSQGCVDAVMWASRAERLRFEPREGMELLATGAVGVYVPRGRYQLVVNALDPVGKGALEVAKRQLEARLRGLGLFDAERKRPIPPFPRTIALVTSPQAAGLADMLKVLSRAPWVRLLLYPVPVQGRAAAPAIAAALALLSMRCGDVGGVSVILLGRGGGSLEDLWAFNEEPVVHAIVQCAIPIITGIGHDIDVSLADLAADHHAHTPTEAASHVLRHWIRAPETLAALALRLRRESRQQLQIARRQIDGLARHELFRRPDAIFDTFRQRLDDRDAALARVMQMRLRASRHRLDRALAVFAQHSPARLLRRTGETIERLAGRMDRAAHTGIAASGQRLDALDARLRALSPLNVLKRGYSITSLKRDGRLVRHIGDVRAGDKLLTRLADGSIESTASDPKQPELF